jgi:hypothetical protein
MTNDSTGTGGPISGEMSDDEKRHDQLTTAPKASEEDADPRITVTEESDGVTRIDVADTAVVRPGNPEKQNG